MRAERHDISTNLLILSEQDKDRKMRRPAWRTVIGGLCLGSLLAVTGISGSAQAQDQVSLRLDWTVLAYHIPFYLAVARGYYKDANLDVTISEGKGTTSTVGLVSSGADTFGIADASGVAKAIGLGAPVKSIMGILQKSPMAILVSDDSEIRSPQDLKGKVVATCPGSPPGVLLPVYLKAAGVSATDVKVLNTDCGPAFYQTIPLQQADAMAGYASLDETGLKSVGIQKIRVLEYADLGIIIPAFVIIASNSTMETQPDVVRRFLAATVKGWIEAKRDEDAAIEATFAANPLLKGQEANYKTEFEGDLKYMETPNTAGKPLGWQSAEDWKRAEDILVQDMGLKRQPQVDAYFTNEFLPD